MYWDYIKNSNWTWIFICTCILCSLSSSNPLESHIIGNITNYFNTIPNNTFFAQQKDFVIPKYAEKNNLRKYISRIRKLESDSFCSDMLYSFRTNQNKTISYIFDLNYSTVHIISIVIIGLSCGMYLIIIGFSCRGSSEGCWIYVIVLIYLLLWLGRMVLSVLLFFYIEKGDINKYDDFLDCPNVKKKFFKQFSDLEKLRKCFLAFTIFNLISEFIDKILLLCEVPDD